ncbi:MAG: HD domain-containing protein, partial [Acidimicrobiales bacterium]
EVLDRIQAETGVAVDVISGSREARLIFNAIRASVLIDPAPALAIDLGGGSLELMVGDQGGMDWSTSVKLGVGRLTAELVREDPLSSSDAGMLRKRLAESVHPVAEEIARRAPSQLIGSSGTLCTLARMAASGRNGSVPTSVNQLTVSLGELEEVHDLLLSLTLSERQKLPGLDARRADLVPAGSVLLLGIMEMFGFDRLTVSEWALREGMLLELIGAHDPAELDDDPRALRMSSVRSLCRRCGWHEAHGIQVARLATDLFDKTLPLHRLGLEDRELLEHGALLHDIGEHVASEGHDRHGAYLILNGSLRGFAPEEINLLACLARFHRRGSPKAQFEAFDALSMGWRERVTKLTAILRVADALDRSHTSGVEGLDVEILSDRVRL